MSRALEEHDYIGLSEVSSLKQTSDKANSGPKCPNLNNCVNLQATELRLGLPGSESLLNDVDNDDDYGVNCPVGIVSNLASGAKRGFSDAINGGSLSSSVLGVDQNLKKSTIPGPATVTSALSRELVVGWPPIRSCRRNSMTANGTKDDDKDDKMGSGCLYIKVSMDGAPYLRKVDLKNYGSYMELSSALEKMFSGFSVGKYDDNGFPTQDGLSKRRLMDDLHKLKYVLTYEDKDGDWMLVGDVPWNMFIDSCRRLRIMKSSEAIGLGIFTLFCL